jgi:hypothetical protein
MFNLPFIIGKTKWGKIFYILLIGLFIQARGQNYDLHSVSLSTPPETIYNKRYTDSLYKDISGSMMFVGRINPSLYTHWQMINGWPSNFDSATMQTKITQAQARAGISVTTTGSGAATYNNTSGVINIPTPAASKRVETFTGTSNASGVYTVTFSTPYATAPNVQASITNQSATNQFIRVSSVTTTGCTINVYARSAVTLLGLEVLLAATTNVSGAQVALLITEQ